ncbi:MAG: DUF5676 family membrane protein [Fidelibacterota bacterium]
MKRIQPYPVAVALSFVFLIFYLVCVAVHLLLPGTGWPMYRGWEIVLFGFTWLTGLSFLLGILEAFVAAFYVAYTLVPLYNYFGKRVSTSTGGEEIMKPLRFTPFVLALTSFGLITYALSTLLPLVFAQWRMYKLWEILLPGFSWITWGSFFIGLVGLIAYCAYAAAIFVPIYNYFYGEEYPEQA